MKIATGRRIVRPGGDGASPLCFSHTFHLAPRWKSLYIERNRTAFRRTSKSHSTASLILLRSFRRGVRAYCTSPLYRCINSSCRNPQAVRHTDYNPPVAGTSCSTIGYRGNCTKDEVSLRRRWFPTSSLSLSFSLSRPATWCNCANEPRHPVSWKTEPRNNLDPG